MEDRYLFKAKRVDNGEWITGSLITCEDGTCKIATSCLEGKTDEPILVCAYDVDRDTICQCTGLKDKNGKLIWENDVVKFDVYYYEKLESSTISQIKWCNDLCALSLVVNDRGTRGTLGHLMDINKEIEAIGNIFDNSELLESEE